MNEIDNLKSQIARLRDTNQVLWDARARAMRREDHQRMRAEAAENELDEIKRLTAHCAMERHFHDPSAIRGSGSTHS